MHRLGYPIPTLGEEDRRLILENKHQKIRCLWVKPMDIPVYVSLGAAEVGIAGRDVILESSAPVCETWDFGFGRCRLVLAAKKDWRDDISQALRVATKYPKMTTEYFAAQNRAIELLPLHGSIELAPLVGLADAIVDLVETGQTLKANGLCEITTLEQISTRLIVHPAALENPSVLLQTFLETIQRG